MARELYKYCPVQKRVVPADQVLVPIPATNAHHFISDDMAPTKHPVDGKFYTSKSRFREVTRAAGCVEVGDAYERDFEPERELERGFSSTLGRLRDVFRRKLNE
jgi:hypothetical protein